MMMPDIDSYEVYQPPFDLSMPSLSGRQVIDRLRAIDPEVN